MREIKFRAWSKNKGMIYDLLVLQNVGHLITCSDAEYLSGVNDKFHWMQFTGLTDKNGKDIYDGDILAFKANYSSNPCGWMKGRVVIGEYCIELHSENGFIYPAGEETDEFPYTSKVIGNIHENSELL